MSSFRSRVGDHYVEICDWVDYRPDPHWWQYLGLPAAAVLTSLILPLPLVVVCGLVSAVICLSLIVLAVLVVLGYVVGRAAWDALGDWSDSVAASTSGRAPARSRW